MNDRGRTLEFLWSGQQGMFELARADDGRLERQLYPWPDVLSFVDGYERFGPLARVSLEPEPAIAQWGNVLWADVDEPRGFEQLVARLGREPSVLVDSGNRGFWAFWKLARPVPAAQIEAWNRGLAVRLNADLGSCARTQLARLPGSRRRETGRLAAVVSFSGVVYEPQELAFVGEAPLRRLVRAVAARIT